MKRFIQYVQQRLSLRLGFLIIMIITVVFAVVFNIFFYYSKQYVRQVAIDRANQLLDNTMARIYGIMDETETVTNYMAVTTPRHLTPDSLLAFTRKTVADHAFLTGFAISMEPNFFPEMGRYFSAYSLRQDDTITTVREGPFEYFDKIWYKTPRTQGTSCWVDAFDDYNEGTLSSREILTSYCCPMRDANGKFVGSITASITLKWLSEAISAIHPYPHSSAIMIGRTGTYLVHPDTAKLFRENIFSDAAPEAQEDINNLGKAMIAGRSGMVKTIVDGQQSYIFYRPLERAGWSIAIVCPASDVFSRYNRLYLTVWMVIDVGLLLLLLFCFQTVRRLVQPLQLLAHQARLIADGQFDDVLPQSQRRDSIGRLTNSFILMKQSLAESVSNIRNVNEELERRNQELVETYQLKLKAAEQKAAFIREMFHQIRTPLNIISGFTQVLSASHHNLPDEEVADITLRMKSSAESICHIARLLSAASVDRSRMTYTKIGCNDLCREAAAGLVPQSADVSVVVDSALPDSFTIVTDRQALFFILAEVLGNAGKFTIKGRVTLTCRQNDNKTVSFIVTDTGPGVPEDERDTIFVQFAKLDSFTDGVGLGLSLCKQTAEMLGGDLVLDTSYQNGARFVLTLNYE